jgi:hypothetical protein
MFKPADVRDPGVTQLVGGLGFDKNDHYGSGGFEPAARWHTADTMHFELDRLVNMIVPADECDADGGSPATAKEEAALTRAASFVDEATTSRAAWYTEHRKP